MVGLFVALKLVRYFLYELAWRMLEDITYVMLCSIWYHLYIFKKRKNNHGGVILLEKVSFIDGGFLNCTDGTISCKASHITALWVVLNATFDFKLHKSDKPFKQARFSYSIIKLFVFVIVASVWVFDVSVPKRWGIIEKKLLEDTCILWWCNICSCSWRMYYRINGENAICVSRLFCVCAP